MMSTGETALARASFSLATEVAPATLWPLAMDTNRLDRATGVRPTRYTYERLDPADPFSYARVGHTRFGLHEYHFVEIGEWTEGRSGWGERRFLRSPFLRRVGLRVELTDGRCAGHAFAEPTRMTWRSGTRPILAPMGAPEQGLHRLGQPGAVDSGSRADALGTLDQLKAQVLTARETSATE